MATRAYRRNRNGQFASAGGGGTKVTFGKAGGFANAAHRQAVTEKRATSARRRALTGSLKRGAKKAAIGTLKYGAVSAGAMVGASMVAGALRGATPKPPSRTFTENGSNIGGFGTLSKKNARAVSTTFK